jgi:hypothetical protein
MSIKIHPLAEIDLQEHVDYLIAADFSDERLLDFQSAVEEAYAKIERNPTTWSFAFRSRRVRKVQILRFRLQVFYLARTGEPPLVLEVAGPGRLPRWRRRL